MGKSLGYVFNVRRDTSTTHAKIGDFKTLEEAKSAMLAHYNSNPKRGNISYRISEDELVETEGIVYRKTSIDLCGSGPYYKKFSAKELEVETVSGQKEVTQ